MGRVQERQSKAHDHNTHHMISPPKMWHITYRHTVDPFITATHVKAITTLCSSMGERSLLDHTLIGMKTAVETFTVEAEMEPLFLPSHLEGFILMTLHLSTWDSGSAGWPLLEFASLVRAWVMETRGLDH